MSKDQQAAADEQQQEDNTVYTLIFIPSGGDEISVYHCRGTRDKCRRLMKQQAQYLIDKIPECVLEVDTVDQVYIFKKNLREGYVWSSISRDFYGKFKIVPLIDCVQEEFIVATPFNSPDEKKAPPPLNKREMAAGMAAAIHSRKKE